jgi:hypothetical protein
MNSVPVSWGTLAIYSVHWTYYRGFPAKESRILCPSGRMLYNGDMGWLRMRVAVCDVCGHRWIPETENPPNCPSKKCRSTLWDKGGVDGRTREARIKAGRSRRTTVKKR